MPGSPSYLVPYLDAARQHGGSFGSLLWSSPRSQLARFRALKRLYDFRNKSILDAGCGRADLLDFLISSRTPPDHYVGLEAIDALADAAELKHHPNATILRADFVRDPLRLYVGADVVVFCGSLNTLTSEQFTAAVKRAFHAASEALLFNFLSTPRLAGARHLNWHSPASIAQLASSLTPTYHLLADYLDGDATIILLHPPASE